MKYKSKCLQHLNPTPLQKEFDKCKNGWLIRVAELKEKHLSQIMVLAPEDYDHTRHVIIGWVNQDIKIVILKDIKSSSVYKMMAFRYIATTAKKKPTNEEYEFGEKMIMANFRQLFKV